jgi:DME family drug/metabolite transporter
VTGLPAPSKRSASGFALVAAAATLWGSDALFRRGLALGLPSTTVVVYEHLILVALTLPLLMRRSGVLRSLTAKDWGAAAVIGFGASALATLLFTAAFRYGDPTTPLLLQKLQPLVAVAAATLLLGDQLLRRFWLYLGAAVVGGFLLSFPDPTSVGIASARPALLAVGAAILWAFGTVLGRQLSAKVDFATLTALRFALGLPAAALFVLIDEGTAGFVPVGSTDLVPLTLLALGPGLASLLLYYRGLRATPASLATLAELAFQSLPSGSTTRRSGMS